MDLSCAIDAATCFEILGRSRRSGALLRAKPSHAAETRYVLYVVHHPISQERSLIQETPMAEPMIDRAAMGRLAKALAFICGPDHPTTLALKAAADSGSDQEIKKARALFIKLSPGDRQAALNM